MCGAAGRPAASEDLLCELCARLHAALARGHLLGRRCKRRAQILRMLFALIDRDSARLHLHVATLCLAVSPPGVCGARVCVVSGGLVPVGVWCPCVCVCLCRCVCV